MRKEKVEIIICEGCDKSVSAHASTTMVWQKKGIKIQLCPDCTHKFFKEDLDDTHISREKLTNVGLWQEGYRENDIKNLLHKWSKEEIQ